MASSLRTDRESNAPEFVGFLNSNEQIGLPEVASPSQSEKDGHLQSNPGIEINPLNENSHSLYGSKGTNGSWLPRKLRSTLRKRVWAPVLVLIAVITIVVPVVVVVTNRQRYGPLQVRLDNSTYKSSNENSESNRSDVAQDDRPSMPPGFDDNTESALLNGSRLAVLNSFDPEDRHLVYQKSDLRILLTRFNEEGISSSFDLEVPSPREQTPIAATLQSINGRVLPHIFYVDENNILRSQYSRGDLRSWFPGTIFGYRVSVSNRAYASFALSHQSWNSQENRPDGFIAIYVCSAGNTIQEFVMDNESSKWQNGFTFSDIAGCNPVTIMEREEASYLFTQASGESTIRMWWRERRSSTKDWREGPQSAIEALAGGYICAGYNHLFYQDVDGSLMMTRFRFVQEGSGSDPSQTRWGEVFEVTSDPIMNQTTMGCQFSQSQALIYYQSQNTSLFTATYDGIAAEDAAPRPEDWTLTEVNIDETMAKR